MKELLKDFSGQVEEFLKSHGAMGLKGFVIYKGVGYFLTGSGVVGLLGCCLGIRLHGLAGVIGLFTGAFLPTVILYLSNERDNEEILKDLKWLYETITVQLQAGLHIRQALQESEGLMQNRRLRMALHKLTERLTLGEDLQASLTEFEQSFRNQYISSFSLILRQMQDSGYAVKLLEDIRLQIEEMERMQLRKKKETLEMQLQVFQMLLFIGILVLVMQGCIMAAVQNIHFL